MPKLIGIFEQDTAPAKHELGNQFATLPAHRIDYIISFAAAKAIELNVPFDEAMTYLTQDLETNIRYYLPLKNQSVDFKFLGLGVAAFAGGYSLMKLIHTYAREIDSYASKKEPISNQFALGSLFAGVLLGIAAIEKAWKSNPKKCVEQYQLILRKIAQRREELAEQSIGNHR